MGVKDTITAILTRNLISDEYNHNILFLDLFLYYLVLLVDFIAIYLMTQPRRLELNVTEIIF